jgi:hypothetical protein
MGTEAMQRIDVGNIDVVLESVRIWLMFIWCGKVENILIKSNMTRSVDASHCTVETINDILYAQGHNHGNTGVKTGVQVVWYGGTSSWNTETNVNSQVMVGWSHRKEGFMICV